MTREVKFETIVYYPPDPNLKIKPWTPAELKRMIAHYSKFVSGEVFIGTVADLYKRDLAEAKK